jgi:hypothetical protein
VFTAFELKQLAGGAPDGKDGALDGGAQDAQDAIALRILEVACGAPSAETLGWLSAAFMAYLGEAGASTMDQCLGMAPDRGEFTWSTKLAAMRRRLFLRAAFGAISKPDESTWRAAGRLSEALSDFAETKLSVYRARCPRHLSGLSSILFAYFESGGESLTQRSIHDVCARTSESLRSRGWGSIIESEKLWETTLKAIQQQEFEQAIKREWERDASLREEFAEDFAMWLDPQPRSGYATGPTLPLGPHSRKRPNCLEISHLGPMHGPKTPRKTAIYTPHSCD